jgi:hypothetical protein
MTMNKGETLLKGLEMPLIAVRTLGEGVLWLTERFVPSNPELPRIGANISIFESGSPHDPATPKALGHEEAA